LYSLLALRPANSIPLLSSVKADVIPAASSPSRNTFTVPSVDNSSVKFNTAFPACGYLTSTRAGLTVSLNVIVFVYNAVFMLASAFDGISFTVTTNVVLLAISFPSSSVITTVLLSF